MGREKKAIGACGEEAARRFLKARGYRILGANVRTPFGELDIVARHNGFTVFVEVKTRISSSLGPPYISVTKLKERHLIKNGLFYLKRYGFVNSNWRIDVVSVRLDGASGTARIELIENAVQNDGY